MTFKEDKTGNENLSMALDIRTRQLFEHGIDIWGTGQENIATPNRDNGDINGEIIVED
jgi:hypothetical protein